MFYHLFLFLLFLYLLSSSSRLAFVSREAGGNRRDDSFYRIIDAGKDRAAKICGVAARWIGGYRAVRRRGKVCEDKVQTFNFQPR